MKILKLIIPILDFYVRYEDIILITVDLIAISLTIVIIFHIWGYNSCYYYNSPLIK